jgi:tRNA threonylcarbamoyl adenosine modification protein YjeE
MNGEYLENDAATRKLGARLARQLSAGDVLLLEGELGAGKTTLVRGLLRELGYEGDVRSPTFDLMHVYATEPPVLHADLYRLTSAEGIGMEDFLESHLVVVEWPDRGRELLTGLPSWAVRLEFKLPGRLAFVSPPDEA